MSNHRHHIHLICDSKDDSLYDIQDHLAIFFEPWAFFTKDLFTTSHESSNYSWRCINACHYSIILLSHSYGALTNTGVSQLHISYLNAKTKNKPIIALIDKEHGHDRHLLDLIHTIEKQLTHVYYFDSQTDMNTLLSNAYKALTTVLNGSNWIKSDADTTNDEKIAQPIHRTDSPNNDNQSTDITKTDTLAQKNLPSLSYNKDIVMIDKNHHDNIEILESFAPKGKVLDKLSLPALNLNNELLISCTAHAFQGGTLIEVDFIASSTWRALLSTLVQSNQMFSIQRFWRLLNELITPQAMQAVKARHPQAHAISRCQVTKAEMLRIQEELMDAGYIHKTGNTPNKQMWQISEIAKEILTN